MLITTSPAPTGGFSRSDQFWSPLAAGERSPEGADRFHPTFSDDCSDLKALARMARQNGPNELGNLPGNLARVVTGNFGNSGITSIHDERVQKLRAYYIEGQESDICNSCAYLGEGWTMHERGTFPLFAPYVFEIKTEDESLAQLLTYDQKDGTTTLHTTHCSSMISTRHHEVVENRDGSLDASDQNAC